MQRLVMVTKEGSDETENGIFHSMERDMCHPYIPSTTMLGDLNCPPPPRKIDQLVIGLRKIMIPYFTLMFSSFRSVRGKSCETRPFSVTRRMWAGKGRGTTAESAWAAQITTTMHV